MTLEQQTSAFHRRLKVALVVLAVFLLLQVVFYVMGRSQEGRLSARITALQTAGMPVSVASLAPPPQPEATNGFTYFLEASEELESHKLKSELLNAMADLVRDGKLTPEQLSEAKLFVTRNSEALALIAQGVRQPRTVLPTDWSQPFPFFLQSGRFKGLAQLQATQTIILAAERKADAAMASFVTGLALASALGEEPQLIVRLTQRAVLAIALASLEASLRESTPSPRVLKREFDSLGEYTSFSGLARTLAGARAMTVAIYDEMRNSRWTFGRQVTFANAVAEEPVTWQARWLSVPLLSPHVWALAKDENYYLDTMAGLIERCLVYEQAPDRPAAVAGLDVNLPNAPWYALISRSMLPVEAEALGRFVDTQTYCTCARVALAALAFQQEKGRVPTSVAEIEAQLGWRLPAEPTTGQPFELRREGKLLKVISSRQESASQGKTRQISFSVPEL